MFHPQQVTRRMRTAIPVALYVAVIGSALVATPAPAARAQIGVGANAGVNTGVNARTGPAGVSTGASANTGISGSGRTAIGTGGFDGAATGGVSASGSTQSSIGVSDDERSRTK